MILVLVHMHLVSAQMAAARENAMKPATLARWSPALACPALVVQEAL